MIEEILINGDSYSAEPEAYSSYLRKKLNIPVTNLSIRGSSNDRIVRSTIEYLLKTQTKKLVIIGFSFITREETYWSDADNLLYDNSKFFTLEKLLELKSFKHLRDRILILDMNKYVIDFYMNVFLLSQFLKNNDIPYYFFSAANNEDHEDIEWDYVNSLEIVKKVNEDSMIENLCSFNIPKWAKINNFKTEKTGHMMNDGHESFSDYLMKRVINDFIS